MKSIFVLDSVDSTQDEIVRRLKAGEHVEAILARKQTLGRGRFGRKWLSTTGESLTLSFAWHEATDWPWPAGLALAAGLAAAEAFDTSIAWPNDLVIGGRKVGGILSEIVTCPTGRVPVIGLGVNLTQSARPEGLPRASSLQLEGRPPMLPTEAAVAFLDSISRQTLPCTFSEIENRWRIRDATRGKKYTLPDGRIAVALRVDEHGCLVTTVDGEEYTVPSAEAIYGSGS
ncbi:MAG: biotin--[acetyl-CoA-carboxylase] ligase [Armatimonadota bacterium]|nr:biotin--[acetyl-CoA-carboxylase] ligase [Armatimonadota bacterium]